VCVFVHVNHVQDVMSTSSTASGILLSRRRAALSSHSFTKQMLLHNVQVFTPFCFIIK